MTTKARKEQIRQRAEARAKVIAKAIGARAWYEEAPSLLTPAENQEIAEILDKMPGHSFWMNAFFQWYNGLDNHS